MKPRRLALVLPAALLAGCATYFEPPPSSYDQAWDAMVGGMNDVGVTVGGSTHRKSGWIEGRKDGAIVTARLREMPSGSVTAVIRTRGGPNEQGLALDVDHAYDVRMGRVPEWTP